MRAWGGGEKSRKWSRGECARYGTVIKNLTAQFGPRYATVPHSKGRVRASSGELIATGGTSSDLPGPFSLRWTITQITRHGWLAPEW